MTNSGKTVVREKSHTSKGVRDSRGFEDSNKPRQRDPKETLFVHIRCPQTKHPEKYL